MVMVERPVVPHEEPAYYVPAAACIGGADARVRSILSAARIPWRARRLGTEGKQVSWCFDVPCYMRSEAVEALRRDARIHEYAIEVY
jgi:hypothetical protein